MSFKLSLEVIGFLISVVNLSAGFLLWYSATVKKDYAAKRDFEHLKRQYEALASNQAQILTEVDRLSDAVNLGQLEIKNGITVLLHSAAKDFRLPKE